MGFTFFFFFVYFVLLGLVFLFVCLFISSCFVLFCFVLFIFFSGLNGVKTFAPILLYIIIGVDAVYNYDLLCSLCVHITMHAALQTQFLIRGQIQNVTVLLKLF